MTLIFIPRRAMVMTDVHAKGQRSVCSKDTVETNGQTDGRTDGADCITLRVEAVGNKSCQTVLLVNVSLCRYEPEMDLGQHFTFHQNPRRFTRTKVSSPVPAIATRVGRVFPVVSVSSGRPRRT